MKTLIGICLWLLLFALCWPLAIVAIFAWPVVLLISLPFMLLGIMFTGVFAFLSAIIMLPARLLGWRPGTVTV